MSEAMADGRPALPEGTYVRVKERLPETAHRAPRYYVGVVVGTDIFRSKYEIGERFGGWGRWLFGEGGCWASPGEVTAISAEEALEVAEEEPADA